MQMATKSLNRPGEQEVLDSRQVVSDLAVTVHSLHAELEMVTHAPPSLPMCLLCQTHSVRALAHDFNINFSVLLVSSSLLNPPIGCWLSSKLMNASRQCYVRLSSPYLETEYTGFGTLEVNAHQ